MTLMKTWSLNPAQPTAAPETLNWRERIKRVREELIGLAEEEGEILEWSLACRAELRQLGQRKLRVEERRQELQAEIVAIETELGLTTEKLS